jgi:hypothetical protein
VHFREILSGYFLFSRFDWSIFVTQLVAKHMKEIIVIRRLPTAGIEIKLIEIIVIFRPPSRKTDFPFV